MLSYLAIDRIPSDEKKALASKLAADSLADFSAHAGEIPPFMADYLLGDLGAWIQKYEPKLSERLQGVQKNRIGDADSGSIHALLQLNGGDVLAAQRIRQFLDEGREVDGLVFYLEDLRERNSKEFEPLLSRVIVAAERGSSPSLETLYWVTQVYFDPRVPRTIKRQFVSVILSRTQPADFTGEPAPKVAYDLLNRALPYIRDLFPEIYEQAVTQSLVMQASFTERQLASETRAKRLKDSLNPIEDLVAEAEATKSKVERNALLAEAAQRALRDKKLLLCMDVVRKLDLDVGGTSHDFWRSWHDQFLKDFVKSRTHS